MRPETTRTHSGAGPPRDTRQSARPTSLSLRAYGSVSSTRPRTMWSFARRREGTATCPRGKIYTHVRPLPCRGGRNKIIMFPPRAQSSLRLSGVGFQNAVPPGSRGKITLLPYTPPGSRGKMFLGRVSKNPTTSPPDSYRSKAFFLPRCPVPYRSGQRNVTVRGVTRSCNSTNSYSYSFYVCNAFVFFQHVPVHSRN